MNGSEARPARIPAVDTLRGFAILLMVVYHLFWDLDAFGFVRLEIHANPFWVGFRWLILSLFLTIMGGSLILAGGRGIDPRKFVRRLLMIAGGAALISLYSLFAFPDAPILFGVLHFIVVAATLGWLAAGLGAGVLVAMAAGAALLGAVSLSGFDTGMLVWTGLGATTPVSLDFVPLFPWLAPVFLGMAAARVATDRNRPRPAPPAPAGPAGLLLGALGRRSLLVYMVHQPVLYGLVWLAASMAPPGSGIGGDLESRFARAWLESCLPACETSGGSEAVCAATCRCGLEEASAILSPEEMRSGQLSPDRQGVLATLARRCAPGARDDSDREQE